RRDPRWLPARTAGERDPGTNRERPAPALRGAHRRRARAGGALSRRRRMSATAIGLDARLADALRGHLERGDEQTLHQAYEIARRAVEEGLGLVDMASMLLRAWRSAGASRAAQAVAGSSPAEPQADGWEGAGALAPICG